LAPGTYHCDAGLISGRLENGDVPVTANAAFMDTRKAGRDGFIVLAENDISEEADERAAGNVFSRRSAKSTIGARGVLNR